MLLYKKESYDPSDPICYPEDDICTGTDKSCRFNHCSCNIGYESVSGACSKIGIIVNNLPYLPHNVYTGVYYYSTVINNEIYALAAECNFKFDGEKWVEINPFSTTQNGFYPYVPLLPIYDKNNINSNTSFVYNNKIYVLIYEESVLNNKLIIDNTYFILQSYDTTTNLSSSITYIISENVATFFISGIILDKLYLFSSSKKLYICDLYGNVEKTIVHNITLTSFSQLITTPGNRLFITCCTTSQTTYCVELSIADNVNILNSFYTSISFDSTKKCGFISCFTQDKYIVFIFGKTVSYLDIGGDKGQGKLFTNFTYTNDITNTFFTPIALSSNPPTIFSSCTTYFSMNNNIFCINGIGDILMLNITFSGSATNNSNCFFTPCYGIAKYDKPLKNIYAIP